MIIKVLDVLLKPLLNTLSLFSPYYIKITVWKFTGLSTERIRSADIILAPKILYCDAGRLHLNFNAAVLEQMTYF